MGSIVRKERQELRQELVPPRELGTPIKGIFWAQRRVSGIYIYIYISILFSLPSLSLYFALPSLSLSYIYMSLYVAFPLFDHVWFGMWAFVITRSDAQICVNMVADYFESQHLLLI